MSEPTPLLPPLKPRTVEPRLWNGSAFVRDPWRTIPDDAPMPIEGRAIVTLARWRSEQAVLEGTGIPIGIAVDPARDTIDPSGDNIDRLQVIALSFPKYTDGRAYSEARRLREAQYQGEIRAIGDVLLDQLPLMLRCGFDAFEITNAPTIEALERSPLPAVSRIYQSGARHAPHPWRHRPSLSRSSTRGP